MVYSTLSMQRGSIPIWYLVGVIQSYWYRNINPVYVTPAAIDTNEPDPWRKEDYIELHQQVLWPYASLQKDNVLTSECFKGKLHIYTLNAYLWALKVQWCVRTLIGAHYVSVVLLKTQSTSLRLALFSVQKDFIMWS